MTYNKADIEKYVKVRKRSFFSRLLCSLLLAAVASAIIAIFPNITLIFICVLVIIFCIVFIIKTFTGYHPTVLFSKEVRGVNIKEHEFAITNRRLTFSSRIIAPRRWPSGFTAHKTRTKPRTSAIVYLRLGDGDVTYIDRLTNAQTDVYEIGDPLYKYAGTRFPIILERKVSCQPCPICGTANRNTEQKCINCGLKTR